MGRTEREIEREKERRYTSSTATTASLSRVLLRPTAGRGIPSILSITYFVTIIGKTTLRHQLFADLFEFPAFFFVLPSPSLAGDRTHLPDRLKLDLDLVHFFSQTRLLLHPTTHLQ
jgi:hypothetical protein